MFDYGFDYEKSYQRILTCSGGKETHWFRVAELRVVTGYCSSCTKAFQLTTMSLPLHVAATETATARTPTTPAKILAAAGNYNDSNGARHLMRHCKSCLVCGFNHEVLVVAFGLGVSQITAHSRQRGWHADHSVQPNCTEFRSQRLGNESPNNRFARFRRRAYIWLPESSGGAPTGVLPSSKPRHRIRTPMSSAACRRTT